MASTTSGLLNLIDETINLIQNGSKSSNKTPPKGSGKKLIFITGRSAAGKTSLGQAFKSMGFVHFDADQFAHGNDPIKDAGKPHDPRDKLKRSKELEAAFTLCTKQGFEALFNGESPDLSVWTPFFSMLCVEVGRARDKYKDKDMVVTYAVYLRSIRDYIRKTLKNENVTFLILNPPPALLADRGMKRVLEVAEKARKTPQQYLQEWGIDLDQIKGMQFRMTNGFEVKQMDEPDTVQIDVDKQMSKEDVFEEAKRLLL